MLFCAVDFSRQKILLAQFKERGNALFTPPKVAGHGHNLFTVAVFKAESTA